MNRKNYWKNVWEKKGNLKIKDLKELDGYEATTIDPKKVSDNIKEILEIEKTDKILEVGCGAGMLAQYIECDYVGIDYSKSLVKKHIKILNNPVLVAEANNIPFKDKYFDKVFAYGIFHYFEDKKYASDVVKELKRVCKGKIFIGDLPERSHRKEHLLYKRSDFKGVLSEGFYNKDRFNVLMDTEPIIKRNILLTPGPATTTDSVKYAQVVSDICPREKKFGVIMEIVSKNLVKIAGGNDEDYVCVLFSGSGTAGMEVAIISVTPPSKKLLIINNGAYGERMVKIAKTYNIDFVELKFNWDTIPNLNQIENKLRDDKEISCVTLVHHETTSGLLNQVKLIGKLVKKYNKIFIVDAISSFAGIPINVKESNIDFMISTSNKCIQGMAGICFIICNKKELERIKYYPKRSFYLDLYDQYSYFSSDYQMRFTPPVQTIYALQKAIDEFLDEGAANRYKRYKKNWEILRGGVSDLGFKILTKKEHESRLLITLLYPENSDFSFSELHDRLYEKGFTIYPGKITDSDTFRIANIGDIDYKDIEKFLKELKRILETN